MSRSGPSFRCWMQTAFTAFLGLDSFVLERFNLECPPADLSEWDEVVEREFSDRRGSVRVAMVGKYMDLLDAYKSLNEALKHAGLQTLTEVKIDYIDAEDIERDGTGVLQDVDAILVPSPSSGSAWACTWRW